MKVKNYFRFAVLAIGVLALARFASAQSDVNFANMTVGGGIVTWNVAGADAGGTITVAFPDGRSFTTDFKSSTVQFDLTDKKLDGVPDGVYNYEIRLAGSTAKLKVKDRGKDDDSESDRAGRKRAGVAPMAQSGTFAIVNGVVIGPGSIEAQGAANRNQAQPLKTQPVTSAPVSANTSARLRNHRFSLTMRPDIVDADDVIVQGSLCVGLDCVNNESFGFDTIRLKENNTRIKFDDTSTSAGFPNNDWQLTANDSGSGGANKFSIEDITGAKVPFTITAGAPTNSVFVDSTGRVGFRTSTPVLDLHVSTGNTPAIRQEQNSGGGFTAQTWDIGANEANWFVRDVTGGSRLPLRIRPGAPTSSIDIAASGNVGVGTASPGAALDVTRGGNNGGIGVSITNTGTNTNDDVFTKYATQGSRTAFTGINRDTALYTIAGVNGFSNSQDWVNVDLLNGNVGIGTTSPDQKLSVSGDADKSSGGTSWGVFSDERLKDIKGGYTRGLNAVMGLRPIRFSYKKDNALALPSDSENIGFSAQALQKVVPEAVTRNANGYLTMHSDPILWAMVNAIQEQQREIASLKAQVQKLRHTPRRHHK